MTNPFRLHGAASRLIHDEAWVARPAGRIEATAKTTLGPITGLGAGCSDGEMEEKRRDPRGVCEPGRIGARAAPLRPAPERDGPRADGAA